MFRSLSFKIYCGGDPRALAQTGGSCRFVYNHFLNRKIQHYKETGETLSSYDLMKELPDLKEQYPFLQSSPATVFQAALVDLDKAYTGFFKHGRGFPKFKRKDGTDSFRIPGAVSVGEVDPDSHSVRLAKLGWFKARGGWSLLEHYQEIGGSVKNITVKQEAGSWYAVVLFDLPDQLPTHIHRTVVVGVDLGVVQPLTGFDSSGQTFVKGVDFSEALKKKECRRRHYQKVLARKKKGSRNREKARLKLARAYKAERDFRKNWVENTSHDLAKEYKHVVFEDLNIQRMTKKGLHKNRLNDGMRRLSLSHLVTRTTQKCEELGGSVVLVNSRNTSRCCSECGSIHKENRKTQKVFKCVDCGHTENADLNASKNIYDRGLLVLCL